MTLVQLLREFRTQVLFDAVEPYLWSDPELYSYADAAQTRFFDVVGWVADTSELLFPAGTDTVARDPLIVRVLEAADSYGRALALVPSVSLVRVAGVPRYLAVGQAGGKFVLDAVPTVDTVVRLRVERRPLELIEGKASELEVPEAYHRLLMEFMASRAYNKPDTDTFDPRRAERALAQFEEGARRARDVLQRGVLPVLTTGYGGY